MVFILHWAETKTFQNFHEKQKIVALEEEMQSLGVDAHATLFFCPCLRACMYRDIYGTLRSYSLEQRWTTLLRLKAPLRKKKTAALRAKHLPSPHNNFLNQCPVSTVLASHNPSSLPQTRTTAPSYSSHQSSLQALRPRARSYPTHPPPQHLKSSQSCCCPAPRVYQPMAEQEQKPSLQAAVDLPVAWPHKPSTIMRLDMHLLLAPHVCYGLCCHVTKCTWPWMAGQNDSEIFTLFPVLSFSQRSGRAPVSNAASRARAWQAAFQQSARSTAWCTTLSCLRRYCQTHRKQCRQRCILSFHHFPFCLKPISCPFTASLMVTNAFSVYNTRQLRCPEEQPLQSLLPGNPCPDLSRHSSLCEDAFICVISLLYLHDLSPWMPNSACTTTQPHCMSCRKLLWLRSERQCLEQSCGFSLLCQRCVSLQGQGPAPDLAVWTPSVCTTDSSLIAKPQGNSWLPVTELLFAYRCPHRYSTMEEMTDCRVTSSAALVLDALAPLTTSLSSSTSLFAGQA